jgi:mono/diheme cytochrome c family protein
MRTHVFFATCLASALSLSLFTACKSGSSSGGGGNSTSSTAEGGGGGLPDQPSMHATTAQIARGKYLIDSVLACGVCHTPTGADGKPDMTMYLAGSRSYQFPMPDGTTNTVNAENITQHKVQGIGLWTDEQIKPGIRTGVDDEDVAFWPIMPYPEYALLTDDDVFAMVAYLRTVPPNGNVVPADTYEPQAGNPPAASAKDSDIPHTTLPSTDPNYASAERGRYLATAGCIQCHTEETAPGIANFAKAYGGGRKIKSSSDAKTATTTNITPDATGLAGWTVADIVSAIKNNTDKSGTALCAASPMGHGFMGDMTDADATDIANYIRTLPPIQNGPFTCY